MGDLTFWTLLVLGSPILWVFACIVWGLLVWAIKSELGYVATIILAASFALYYWLGSGKDALGWIVDNPFTFIQFVLGYIAIGIVWATFYWWLPFCRYQRLEQYLVIKRQWLEANKLHPDSSIPEDKKKDFLEYLYNTYVEKEKYRWAKRGQGGVLVANIKPRAWNFKVDIVRWLSAWPVSMFWWFGHGFIVGFWTWLQRSLSGFYNWISDRVFRHVENDWK